ncbi:sulfatase [Candidatus Woesebacteria bacterium]|nr:sulfatase [Candidatus Woesebacteria bacterium]
MNRITLSKNKRLLAYISTTLFIILLSYVVLTTNIWTNPKNPQVCNKCNIVLIVIDPLRADELPCYGYSANTAPNICRFAQNNTLYTNTYSQSSWTLPSIMSLFSSQYPTQHNVFVPNVDVLPATATTLPMALKAAGYETTFIGPVDEATQHVPLDKGIGRGFETVIPYTSLSDAAAILQNKLKSATPNKPVFVFIHSFDLRNDSVKAAPTVFPLDPNYTYGLVDPYLRSITLPTQETRGNITSYRRVYDERLRQLDEQFLAITQSISDTHSGEKTIVAITSDHGDEFGEHGQSSHGINLYKSVTHVPFILSLPYQTPLQSDKLVQSIDIYPTLLGAVGIKTPASARGINVSPQSKKQQEKQNQYVISQLEPEKHLVTIRNHQWSYHFDPTNEKTKLQGSLYNLQNDSEELRPIVSNTDMIGILIRAYEHILK